jgi:hypothetical protein
MDKVGYCDFVQTNWKLPMDGKFWYEKKRKEEKRREKKLRIGAKLYQYTGKVCCDVDLLVDRRVSLGQEYE